jgi:hypothetical protein
VPASHVQNRTKLTASAGVCAQMTGAVLIAAKPRLRAKARTRA